MIKNNFITYLKSLKISIYFICIVFFLSFLIGIFFPIFFKQKILEFLVLLENQISGLTTIELISFIFNNNVKASFFAMILGLFFGIFPIIMIIINGYLIGFVLHYAISIEGISTIWKLFPHGIFELPAIILSASMGLNLGYLFILNLLNKNKSPITKEINNSLIFFLLFIIPLLLIAGIVEGLLIYFLK